MSIDPYLENWIYGHVPLHTYLCIMVRYKKHSRLEVKADPEIRIQGGAPDATDARPPKETESRKLASEQRAGCAEQGGAPSRRARYRRPMKGIFLWQQRILPQLSFDLR